MATLCCTARVATARFRTTNGQIPLKQPPYRLCGSIYLGKRGVNKSYTKFL